VVGAGPAGLSAAHYLSLKGYQVTVFEKTDKPGGMLYQCIPKYRMPRDVIDKEIESLLDENIILKCNADFGTKITIDTLFEDGFKAIFLAVGAHKSRQLKMEGEGLEGVYPAIDFLKAFNLKGENWAKGHVGVIGGGDSAVDAARVSLRQEGVESVTIFYRRTRSEMPALDEEIEAAIEEGVELKTLVSPLEIKSRKKGLLDTKFISNRQGDVDASGRRRPLPVPGTEQTIPLNTLIVTIGDVPDSYNIMTMGIDVVDSGNIKVDKDTLTTNKPGVFAGGDVVTGPNTVVEAIAAGKRAAVTIDQYVGEGQVKWHPEIKLPAEYIKPTQEEQENFDINKRIDIPRIHIKKRKQSLSEIELSFSEEEAKREAGRCMRCDLEFTEKLIMNDEKIEKVGRNSS
jgi:NADH-quinone oxidoreductase subunit F